MKIRFSILICVAVFFLESTVSSQTTFRNPVISGLASDPSICRVGDDYYLVTSTFEYFPGLPVYQSKDLVHWKMIGYALTRASQNPLKGCESSVGGQYAPTIRYNNGTFYVICTNYGGQGSQGVYYVTATDPAGQWSEPHWLKNWYVDPSLMFENDSMYYLSPDNNGSFLLGTINPATHTFIKPVVKIAEGTGGAAPEGPHLYKTNGYYYLMSAEGGTGYQHKEVIQRSVSPWGPYTASPVNPVISHEKYPSNPFQAIGHADLVETPDGWWLVCLGFRPKGGNYHHLGRETFLAPVTWNADGWPKVGTNGIVGEELTAPNIPQHVWAKETARDDFDSTSLRLAWNFIRNPHAADWSLGENPGFLRLNGSALSFKEKDSPAFIGRRQTAFDLVASAKINFIPTAENEEAGLVVRGNDKNHYDFLITMLEGKRVIMLRKYLQGQTTSLNYREIPEGDIILRISASGLEYKFWFQQEGKTAELIGSAQTKNISTEVIGGFTGTFIGMYASGNGTKCSNPADFDWFDFEEEPALPYDWAAGIPEMQNNMETPRIASATALSYDEAKIVFYNIPNETGYIIEKYGAAKFDSVGNTNANDTVFTEGGLSGSTLYQYRVKAKNALGTSFPSVSASVLTLQAPGPYTGTPYQVPGKIEAENYDKGINSVSYYDTDAGNSGGQYRSEDVDIESCSDAGGGFDVGYLANGEWLLYTINVTDTVFDIELRIASSYGGNIKLELDGKEIARTGIATTGGWQTWKSVILKNVKMEQGNNRKLKVTLSAGFNFNWINFVKTAPAGIKETGSSGIRVYPNPTTNTLHIQSDSFKYSSIEIFNLEGKSIMAGKLEYQPDNTIEFELPPGGYILSLNNLDFKKTLMFTVTR